MSSALRRFLVDFEAAAPPGRRVSPLLAVPAPPGADPSEPAEAAPGGASPEAVAAAVAVAVEAARAEAAQAHAAVLDGLSARHAAELADARAGWAAREGDALAEGFRSSVAALGDALGDAAAAALEPLLGRAARALAVDGLRAAVADLVLAGAGGAIAVTGPADLVEALRGALEAAGTGTAGMSFAAADAPEVRVTADNSRIETRLGAWAAALGRRLPGGDAARGPDRPEGAPPPAGASREDAA